MAGRKRYGASFEGEKLPYSSDVLQSLWLSGSASSLHGSNSMVNFENASGGDSLESSFFHTIDKEENGDDDYDGSSLHQPGKKRRLSVEQVRFLEKNFEAENKLEPERKVQLAKELGLQPRQVAIWFQNRRARFKNKQLEKEYDSLKASFDKLNSDHENLLKDNGGLKNKIDSLKGMLVLKEKGKPLESREGIKSLDFEPQNMIPNAASNLVMGMLCKQEDASSAKSDVFDSDSPHCTENQYSSLLEPADSSHVFEPADQSDFSQDEDDDLSKSLLPPPPPYLMKLEDSCYGELPSLEDQQQPFCFWPY